MEFIGAWILTGCIVAVLCYFIEDCKDDPEWEPMYHVYDILLWPIALYGLMHTLFEKLDQ